MVKITPKVRTILLCLLLIGSCFTTYATTNLSFLTPSESDTNVSFFKVSKDEKFSIFQDFSVNNFKSDPSLYATVTERAIARFNPSLNSVNSNKLLEVLENQNLLLASSNFVAIPTITLGNNSTATVCHGATSGSIPYTTTTGNPNRFSITYKGTAPSAGFINVVLADLPTSPKHVPIIIPSSATPGTYTADLTVSNQAGERATAQTITIVINPKPIVTTANTKTICSGSTTSISLTASVSSSFSWTIGSITGNISGASAGSGSTINQTLTNPSNTTVGSVQYIVTPTSNTGNCVGSPYIITVSVNPSPSVTTANSATICSGSAINISLTASVSSSFTWTIGTVSGGITGAGAGSGSTINQTLINPSNTTAGSVQYLVTPTSNTGECVGSPYTITVNVNPKPTVTTTNSETICSGSATNISLTASVPSSFTWTIGTISAGITGASAGSGSAINQTLNNSSNTTAGSVQYLVTPTSNTGECVGSPYTITVNVNPKPTVTTTNSETICSGSATNISLTASVPSSFTWTLGSISAGITGASAGSGSAINQTLNNSSNTTAGSVQYLVTPTSNTGECVGSPYTITVNVNPKPTVTTTNSETICSGSATNISLTASIPSSFTWTLGSISAGITGASAGSGSAINQTLTNSNNSTVGSVEYIITPTSSAGSCEGLPYTIIVNVNPTTTFTKPTDIIACNDEIIPAINFTGATVPGTTYSWTIDNPSIGLLASGTGNIPTFTASNGGSAPISGTITVTPTANNCVGTPETFEITVNPSINIEYNITNVACNGENNGAFTIINTTGGNGDYRYSLTNSAFNTTKTFTDLTAGIYTIYVQDTAGCTYQEDVTVDEPVNLDMSTTPTSTPTSCFGGSDGTITSGTVIGGNGNYVYSIDNNTFSTSNEFTGLAAGSYTIFVKDEKECALQVTINVEEADELSATLSKTNVSCFDGNDGTITVSNPTGGSGNYEYQLDNGLWQTNSTFADLSAGSYNVSIRDSSLTGCEVILNDAFQITQPSAPLTVTVSSTRTTAYNTPTGSATANPTGGTAGYTYQWRISGESSIIQNTKTASNLPAGDYEVTVIDSKGCEIIESITIIDALEAFIVSNSVCPEDADKNTIRNTTFSVEENTAHGGIPPYTYSWDLSADAPTRYVTGLGPHELTYSNPGNKSITLTVTDSTGAEYLATDQVYVGKCFEACGQAQNVDYRPDLIYIGDINGTPINPNNIGNCNDAVAKYLWLPITKSSNAYNPYIEVFYTINPLSTPSSYGQTGCVEPQGVILTAGMNLRITNNPIEIKCGENLSIENFFISYTNNPNKACGNSNNSFCYSTNEPVNVPTALNPVATPSNVLCKGGNSGLITTKVTGGYAPYFYSLTGVNGPYVSNNKFTSLTAGNYRVYVRDTRDSKTFVDVVVGEPLTSITIDQLTPSNPICFGENGEATVIASGGTPFAPGELPNDAEYEYLWNDSLSQTTPTATNLVAGEYTITVIDANGCQELGTVNIVDPPQLTVATTGEDQTFNCGFNITTLEANSFDETIEKGTWSILSGTGGTITEPNNPFSSFSGTAGIYELQWNISDLDGNCGTTSTMLVTFASDCSKIDFDGLDDHVLLGDNYGLTTGPFTLEVWVKLKSTTGVRTVVSKRNSKALGSGGYDLIVNNGAPTFRWGNNSVTTSSKLTTNRWYHLGVIYDNSKVFLYVDGINVGNKSLTNPTALANPFLIGAMHNNDSPDTPENYFHGWIEELRIWDVALETEQLRFMMNQRLELNTSPVIGTVLPVAVPNNLSWNNLTGYYQLLPSSIANGVIPDLSSIKVSGELKNIETNQENTAPMPYFSNSNGVWSSKNTWLRPTVWDYPNAVGINGEKINWNIAKTSHDITSGGHDISLLGLLSESNEIKMLDPNGEENETNTGQGLLISHYLKLDGNIKLFGDSQLVQLEGSVLDASSSGYIEKDQQGTASSYNYNYWSSPVVPQANPINSTYSVAEVMMDGTLPNAPRNLNFGNGVTYADGAAANPRKISNYWIYKFRGKADEYSDYQHIGSTGTLTVGEGFTMKGTSGNAAISDRQNYVFKGKPNNGDITLTVGKDQNYLLGNPYPSALDANKFILDNLNASGGTNTKNIFNGALYFWDHFGGKTHTLREYVGGYATYNLIGGVKAIATDDRINSNTDAKTSDENVPGQYIPVGQGFFINTVLDDDVSGNYTVDGGAVIFRNSQRAFKRESPTVSHFLSQEKATKNTKEASSDAKIRLDFKSPLGYLRQILVGTNEFATNGFDLGYDAPLNDYNVEDFFWLINDREFVIQGVSNFDKEQVLPVGMYISQKGKFSIEIYELENVLDETEIYLRDIEKERYYDLRDSKFEMEIESGDYFNRFEIVFSIPEDYNPNATDEESEEEAESKDDSEEEENSTNNDSEEESSEETDNSAGEESEEDSNQTVEEDEKVDDLLTEYISILDIDIHYMSRDRELSISNPFLLPIKRVEIYNLLGQQIQKYIRVGNQKEIRLPVSEYATGIYVVKLYSENSQISKNIMLKQ